MLSRSYSWSRQRPRLQSPNILTKRDGPFDSLMLTGWSSLFAVPQIMLVSLALEHGQAASLSTADAHGWLALAYTVVIGGIVAFGLWFWLIARCSMDRVAPFALLLPVFAMASSVLFLGERLMPTLTVGGLLALAGVAFSQGQLSAQPK
jgi:O-acetylserine/cysteine efflux transporter